MNNNEKDSVVIFTDEAELAFSDILKNHGLEETDDDFDRYISEDKETKEMIIRDAITVIVQKKIPETKLVEFLQKHLEIPSESVEKILRDIRRQLLPSLLVYPEEKLNDPVFREEVSKKISGYEKKTIQNPHEPSKEREIIPQKEKLPYAKKVEVKNVEENAEKINQEGKRGPDVYREPIE